MDAAAKREVGRGRIRRGLVGGRPHEEDERTGGKRRSAEGRSGSARSRVKLERAVVAKDMFEELGNLPRVAAQSLLQALVGGKPLHGMPDQSRGRFCPSGDHLQQDADSCALCDNSISDGGTEDRQDAPVGRGCVEVLRESQTQGKCGTGRQHH
jgi:hypothetical protein